MATFNLVVFSIFNIASGVVAQLMFCLQLQRRSKFWLRLAVALVFSVIFEVLEANIFPKGFVWDSASRIASFFVFSLFIWFCFKEKYFSVLFCCNAGKCVLHFAEYIFKSIFVYIDPNKQGNIYIRILLYAAIYTVFYFLCVKRVRNKECDGINNIIIISLSVAIVLVADILVRLFDEICEEPLEKISVYLIVCILFFLVLMLQFGLLSGSKLKQETEIVNQLRVKEQEQYKISKNTMQIVNMRYHDIKNILASHRSKFTEDELSDIEQAIKAYDISFKTGNKTLDTILTEKNNDCKNMNIRLECVADGAPLSFMSDIDIYSLFLNALNNAITAVDKVREEKKRLIQMNVKRRGNLVFIQLRNYYAEEILYAGKRKIATTKSDKRHHGYGLLSMEAIAESYGGSMSVKTEDKEFCLGFVIPMPEN